MKPTTVAFTGFFFSSSYSPLFRILIFQMIFLEPSFLLKIIPVQAIAICLTLVGRQCDYNYPAFTTNGEADVAHLMPTAWLIHCKSVCQGRFEWMRFKLAHYNRSFTITFKVN